MNSRPATRRSWIAPGMTLALIAALAGGCRSQTTGEAPPAGPPARNVSRDPWALQAESPLQHAGAYLGNGFVGMRFGASGTTDSPDGTAPPHAPFNRSRALECVVSGLYADEHLVPAPNWGAFRFQGARGDLFPEDGAVTQYRQRLDLRRGELTTTWRAATAPTPFSVQLVTRVHRDQPNLVTFTARLVPDADGELRFRYGFGEPDLATWAVLSHAAAPGQGTETVRLRLKRGVKPASTTLTLSQAVTAQDDRGRALPLFGQEAGVGVLPVKAKQAVTLTKWVCVSTDSEETVADPVKRLAQWQATGIPRLAESHAAAWKRLWQSDIVIEGDLEAQQVVRSSLFYLLESVRPGGRWSVAPMGLSGVQWGGHIFWDADTWMFPVLGLLHPDLAEPLVDYRVRTLLAAKEIARKRGLKGADYPTESAVTGREMAPAEFPFERHNTADVGIAQYRAFLLSGDRNRLAEKGYPVLKATSDLWASRATWNAAKDRYEIRHVISPDETAGFVDNDAYTNAAAALNLRYAAEAGRLLGQPVPPLWERVAAQLWVPYDAANRRYLEHEGFVPTRRKLKQADTQLLFFPLGLDAPPDVQSNTLSYYAALTSPLGPAMTSSVHAVLAARLAATPGAPPPAAGEGEDWRDAALGYFRESYRPFLRAPLNDFSEKRSTVNTTFLTGCAGVALGPLYGFGGIRYTGAGITAKPLLPRGWTRLKITGIHYRGKVYTLDAASGQTTVFRAK